MNSERRIQPFSITSLVVAALCVLAPCKAMDRSGSFVAAQAIREFVALNEWQIGEIKKAIAEADHGDFASDEEVQQSLKRWTRRAR